ncbi:septum formation protein Maf [candidate division WOR-3 bacterium]|nr:septum formation protein Maf [candidate division WOR-3 bacterium]TET78727.1 MAG: septum formation protein Maf [Candidatus Cloacimonadota bacterium]
MKRLILASASPRRKKALKKLNIPFLSVSNNIDERKEIENLEMIPEDSALYLSRRKAEITSKEFPDDFVLGMDTIVVLNSEIIGKPKDDKDAVTILWKLNGSWHTVITGVTLINKKKGYEDNGISKTKVKFIKHNLNFIKKYVAKGESFDKAGAYAIQSDGKHLIEEIKGDYSNVVGFPEKTVIKMLERAGLVNQIRAKTRITN